MAKTGRVHEPSEKRRDLSTFNSGKKTEGYVECPAGADSGESPDMLTVAI